MDRAICSECSAKRSTTISPGGAIHATIVEPSGKEYDVFLNFRGKDTRRNIVNHLHLSLTEAHISVFLDDTSLPYGEDIERELLAAIERSKVAIPIISEDYASSDDCLRELVQILKCKERGRLTVMPIFYKVKPSDIGSLRNSFQRIQSHIIKYHGSVVESWKEALKRIANMKGLVVDDTSYEGTMVRSIVDKVKKELKSTSKKHIDRLVGIDEKARAIMEALSEDTIGVHIVGIFGTGGIGKTTLARYIYNQLSHSFDFCSFVTNFGGTLSGDISVEQLISSIVERGSVKRKRSNKGMNRIEQLLHDKKVLIVLDDIDSGIGMRTFQGMCSYLGSGSKIILTTRNARVFSAPAVSLRYALCELDFAQSMELFCEKAFGRLDPPRAFEHYSNRVVEISGGLPLALEVIGSILSGKEEVEWRRILKRLEDSPSKAVEKLFLLAYEELDDKQKEIFLDIASFPDGLNKDSLEAVDTEAVNKLEALSLVKCDNDNKLHMHDLLRDLGRRILQVEGGEASRHTQKGGKEFSKSTPLIEEVPVTPTTQLLEQGHFPVVQACTLQNKKVRTTAIAKGKEPTVALEEPWWSQYEFGKFSKTTRLRRGSSEVPLQLTGYTGAASMICNSMEAEISLSQPFSDPDFLFRKIDSLLAEPRYSMEEKLPDSTQEAISLVDSIIKHISLPNAADIDFSRILSQALESLRQSNAFHDVPIELLKNFQSASTCFARTPEYLDQIQSAKSTFGDCMRAKKAKVDEISNLRSDLSFDSDALEQTRRDIDVLEKQLTSLKAKKFNLESKRINAVPTLSALADELERCSSQLLKARAQLDDIPSHEEHIKANHHRFLHYLHEIKNSLRRKNRNQIF